MINVVSRLKSEHDKLFKKIKKHFSHICWYNLKEDVNRIVFATNKKLNSKQEWKNIINNLNNSFLSRAFFYLI